LPLAHIWRSGFDSIGFSVIWLPVLCGLFLGTVMLIESLTTLEALTPSDEQTGSFLKTDWSRNIRVSAAVNMLSSVFGLACSSWSTSRSKLMEQAQARSRLSSFIHGLSIALIAIIAEPLMSRLPVLAIAVALTLVGIQMIDSQTVGLWQPGYRANAKPQNLWGVWWFWLVLAITFCSGKAIVAFIVAWGAYSIHQCLLHRSQRARAKVSRASGGRT
jgi:MFS superfamily sulfate permease-like transporter